MSNGIVPRLNDEIRRVVALPAIRDRLAIEGLAAAPSSPEEFVAYLRKDIEKWARVVTAANIKPD
jgi:tripartite-type tricarboxylate transporter receptor subunit TctC